MASINYAARQISVKIVYYGPGLSGKTTNLQVIHKKTPQEHKSDMVSLATETDRTLYFDFLPLDLGKIKGFATKFQLYTVPGQVYYNATRKLVLRGVDGVVFVADSGADKVQENLESFQNLEENLAEYGYQKESVPIIIQYNKRDLPNALPVDELNRLINRQNLPYGEGIAYKGVGVFDTLKQIGKIVIDYLNKKYSRSASGGGRAAAPAPATGAFPAYQPPQQQGFQQMPATGAFPAYQPPQGFQQQPGTGAYPAYQPPATGAFPAYQPPQQQSFDSFEPPAPAAAPYGQGFQQQPTTGAFPAYQPPQQQSFDSFEPPAPAAPYGQGFQQPPATGAFPAYQPPQQQSFDSFEPPPYGQQGYQQPGAFPAYQPPQQQSFDSFEPPTPSPYGQAAPTFDPYAQQAPQWGAPQSAADDPFLQSPQQAQGTPSFEPPPASGAGDYDDIFMPQEPPGQQPPQPPPGQGGYQHPFDLEMTPPPPSSLKHQPLAGATMGGAGMPNMAAPVMTTPGMPTQGYHIPPLMGQPMPAAPAPQFEHSFNQQPPNAFGAGFGAQPAFAPPAAGYPQNSAAPQEGSSGSELDNEIAKYQREIEERQKKMRSGGAGAGGFPPPPGAARPFDAQEAQPYQAGSAGDLNRFQAQSMASAPLQPESFSQEALSPAIESFSPAGGAAAIAPFSPNPSGLTPFSPTGGMEPFSPESMDMKADSYRDDPVPTPENSAIFDFEAELSAKVNQKASGKDDYSTDSAMVFSSGNKSSKNSPKKPVKPPVNPAKLKNAQQQQKGFMSKLFNKNQ